MASVETEYKRRRRKVWAGGGLAALALYAGGGYFFDTNIEDDLEKRVPKAVADAGLPGVTAKFSGQDGTITCDEPLSDPDLAKATALDVRGVNKIDMDDGCLTNTAEEPAEEPTPTTADEATPETEPAADYETVADIVSDDPGLQQLANRLGDSDLSKQLGDAEAGPYTVFAPSKEAFDAMPDEQLNALEPNPELRDQVLGYHVVEGNVTEFQLVDGAELKTVTGETLVVAGEGADATINGAKINTGPIAAKNGLVYTIDTVLVPEGLELTPEQPSAAVDATLDQGGITLTGVVASEAEREALVAAAAAQVGEENVTDKLAIDADTGADAETVGNVASLINGMGDNLVSGQVGFNEGGLYVNGTYAEDANKDAMTEIADGLEASAELEPRPEADADSAADLEGQLNDYVAQNPILFEPGSAQLSPESTAVIDKIAASMQQVGNLAIKVEGHTDSDGDDAANQALSDQRAAAVAAAIVEQGVPKPNVTSEGFGETQLVTVDGAEDKAASRRVVFQLSPADAQ